MQTLPESETPTVVFTCTTPGVFCLSLVGPGIMYVNSATSSGSGQITNSTRGDAGQTGFPLFLDTGDQLLYSGPGAQLAGFRQGNEFEDV